MCKPPKSSNPTNQAARRWGLIALLAVVCAHPVAQASPSLPDILKLHNVQPLDPPPRAPPLTLPGLDGKPIALGSLQGHWVLLTFFATWCGPCAAEMPSLQGLYDSMHSRGLDILAVAVDPEDDVAGYVRKKNLSFPVVLDTQGQAASTYQASSIPITYLVNPAGQLVGVAQGARDWLAASTLIDAVMAHTPVTGEPSPIPAPQAPPPVPVATAPVPLPPNLVPPEGHAQLEEGTVHVGDRIHLEVTVRWAGALRDYVLLPPSVDLPPNVRDLGTAATTSTDTGRAIIVYRLTLQPTAEESIKLDPIEVRFLPAGQSEATAIRIAGPTVQVLPYVVGGLRPIVWASIAAGIVAAALSLALAQQLQKRRSRRAKVPATAPHTASIDYEAALRARMGGDALAFLSLMHKLLPPTEALHAEVVKLLEAAQYGGQGLDAPTYERLLRAAKRRVEVLAPDPQRRAEQSGQLPTEET